LEHLQHEHITNVHYIIIMGVNDRLSYIVHTHTNICIYILYIYIGWFFSSQASNYPSRLLTNYVLVYILYIIQSCLSNRPFQKIIYIYIYTPNILVYHRQEFSMIRFNIDWIGLIKLIIGMSKIGQDWITVD